MQINATLINLYHLCHRELWLHYHGIRMEHTSDTVYAGKLIGETTYRTRAGKNKQLEIDGVKIDFFDPKTRTVYETKKSNKAEAAHIAQVKFYLYLLDKNGVKGASGIIEYPELRERTIVPFQPEKDIQEIERWLADIERICSNSRCPGVIEQPICRSCSYRDFCYAGEEG
ncbi:MAG: CRISPR-associated protein Cas4 [Lewinella sp.]|nr:CRISPR-associated protein Cas4 [Lewinella sp.]